MTNDTPTGGGKPGVSSSRVAQEDGNALKRPPVVITKAAKRAVVYPWNLVPDWAIAALTAVLLIPYLPLFAAEIVLGMSWHVVLATLNRLLLGIPLRLWLAGAAMTTHWCAPLMRDPRDAEKAMPTFFLMIYAPLLFLWMLRRHMTFGFEWWLVPVYHVLRIGPRYRCFAWLYVLIHQEGHCYPGFFKPPLSFLNFWMGVTQCWSALFFGQLPGTFRVSHNKCHHRHDNMLDDTHTNLDLDRSDPWSFVLYFPRFAGYWSGWSQIAYFGSRKEWGLLREVIKGMVLHYGIWVVSWWLMGPTFTAFYVIFPHFEGIIFFGGISYLWHAFCEPGDPYNPYINSMTIVEGHDNIWGEDFHVEHHNRVDLHPAQYQPHYEAHQSEFASNQATIFRDCEEGTLLKMLLSQEWDEMASKFVDLNGKMTHEQKKELLLRRLRSRFNRPADDAKQMAAEAKLKTK